MRSFYKTFHVASLVNNDAFHSYVDNKSLSTLTDSIF